MLETGISRRDLLRSSLALAGLAMTPLASAVAAAAEDIESFSWCACVINCGQRCPVRCFTKAGKVIRIETDNTLPDATDAPRQIRACQRGRSMRERIYSPDRLKYPMKRIGKRGEGKFERISWEEAVKTIASEWKRIRDAYGNESIYWQYCSGQQSIVSSRRAWQRLMNLMGGFLKYYGSYSNAQLAAAFPLTYGGRPASLPSVIADAELYVLFGNNPSVTRPSGGRAPMLRSSRRSPTNGSRRIRSIRRSSTSTAWATTKRRFPHLRLRMPITSPIFSAAAPIGSKRRRNGRAALRESLPT